MTDATAVERLLSELVAIESTNPDLVDGGSGEARIADHVAAWLDDRGFEVRRVEQRTGRPSVVATARGTGGGRTLLLNGHLDTVSLESYDGDGLEPRREGGRLHGRGAYDMKSGLAAMMVAAHDAVAAGPLRGDVVLTLVADEENASTGTTEVLRHVTADAAVVSEPTGLDVVTSHLGFSWFDVTIGGVPAHGSRPDLGVDAIVKAGVFLTALGGLSADMQARPVAGTGHPGSIHASLVRGGQELSSYPERCTISLEARTPPGVTAADVEAELTDLLERLVDDDPGLAWGIELLLERDAFTVDHDDPVVRTLLGSFERVAGRPAVVRGERLWTDCALLSAAGVPAVLFGVDGAGAHAAEEWVDLDSLRTVTAVLTDTISTFCA